MTFVPFFLCRIKWHGARLLINFSLSVVIINIFSYPALDITLFQHHGQAKHKPSSNIQSEIAETETAKLYHEPLVSARSVWF